MTPEILKVLTALLLGVLAVAIGMVIWLFMQGNSGLAEYTRPTTPQILPAQDVAVTIPAMDVMLVESDGTSESKKLFSCQESTCKPVRLPNIEHEMLFDGQSWYFLASDGSLRQQQEDKESELIVAPTELVTPRSPLISSTGKEVAYWLDNIDEREEEQRTELWTYDKVAAGTRVVAENLIKNDIVTRLRWNKAGTAMWFVADSGEAGEEKLELIVAGTKPPLTKARFLKEDIEKLEDVFDHGVVDISPSGTVLAYAENADSRFTMLRIAHDGGTSSQQPVRGRVPFIQWLDESRLIYAVQAETGIEFWQWHDNTAQPISRHQGVLMSAQVDEGGKYIAYTMKEGIRGASLYILDIRSGRVRLQSKLPSINSVHVAWVRPATEDTNSFLDVSSTFSDEELISFIEKQSSGMIGEGATLERIMSTDKPNTVFIDFETEEKGEQRVLLVVRDITYPEWTVLAKYEPAGGQWRRLEGSGVADPIPKKLYEWENPPGQWILKTSF
ncbi:MAG: hypothetical protein HYR90_01250 [Candidatus Andersenbacteria bacterium]|nr:hypothetical protein [Candidatus Andersenbacteria bacterium]MBI3250495.1 hypothetical protein [Candidatus Andersenbacteria bacterium]